MLWVQTPGWVSTLLSLVMLIVLSSAAIFSNACGPAVQLTSSAAVGAVLGYTGLRKGSLSKSGAAFAQLPAASLLGASLSSDRRTVVPVATQWRLNVRAFGQTASRHTLLGWTYLKSSDLGSNS